MTPSVINALLATSYNLHTGPIVRGDAMTPTKAALLPQAERFALAAQLAEKGGSDLYTQEQARTAMRLIQS